MPRPPSSPAEPAQPQASTASLVQAVSQPTGPAAVAGTRPRVRRLLQRSTSEAHDGRFVCRVVADAANNRHLLGAFLAEPPADGPLAEKFRISPLEHDGPLAQGGRRLLAHEHADGVRIFESGDPGVARLTRLDAARGAARARADELRTGSSRRPKPPRCSRTTSSRCYCPAETRRRGCS